MPTRMIPTRTKNELSSPLVSRRTWNAARRRMGTEKNVAKRVGIKAMTPGSFHPGGRAGHDLSGPFPNPQACASSTSSGRASARTASRSSASTKPAAIAASVARSYAAR